MVERGFIMRKEHDFLGELEVADELYYGVQTIFYTIYYFTNNFVHK